MGDTTDTILGMIKERLESIDGKLDTVCQRTNDIEREAAILKERVDRHLSNGVRTDDDKRKDRQFYVSVVAIIIAFLSVAWAIVGRMI